MDGKFLGQGGMQGDAREASSASFVLPHTAKGPQKSLIPFVSGNILESRQSKVRLEGLRPTQFGCLDSLIALFFVLRSPRILQC